MSAREGAVRRHRLGAGHGAALAALVAALGLGFVSPASAMVDPVYEHSLGAGFAYEYTNFTNSPASVNAILPMPGGGTIVGGWFTNFKGLDAGHYEIPDHIAGLTPSGDSDADYNLSTAANPAGSRFSTGFFSSTDSCGVRALAREASGTLLMGGCFTRFGGTISKVGAVYSMIGGTALPVGLVRMNDFGIDTAFAANLSSAYSAGTVRRIFVQPDGKILLFGGFTPVSAPSDVVRLIRLLPSGLPDTSFNTNLRAALGYTGATAAVGVALRPDGRIVAVGAYPAKIALFNADGTANLAFSDTVGIGFNYEPATDGVAALPDNRVVVGGWPGGHSTFRSRPVKTLVVLRPDGSLDTAFDDHYPDSLNEAVPLFVQPDGKIFIKRFLSTLLRVNPDGTSDTSFNGPNWFVGGYANYVLGDITAVALAADGHVLVGFFGYNAVNGRVLAFGSTRPPGLARLLGSPTAPLALTGTTGNRVVNLTFRTPFGDGGSPITDYVITPTPAGGSCTVVSQVVASLRATCTGLPNGVARTFTVRAVNAQGTGLTATTVRLTPGAPSVPRSLTVAFPAVRQARIGWAAPASAGVAPILRYEVCRRSCSVAANWTSTGLNRFVLLTSLTKNSRYTVQVRARNSLGLSPVAATTFTQSR